MTAVPQLRDARQPEASLPRGRAASLTTGAARP